MDNTESVAAGNAADLIAHAEDVRVRTRDALAGLWFPMVLFGALTVISAAIVWLYGGEGLAVFWAVSGPVGGVITALYYGMHEERTGVTRSPLPYLGIVAVLFVGAFGLPMITTGTLREVISGIWVGMCYIAFGFIERSWPVASAGAATVGAILVLLALNPLHIASWAAIVTGAVFLGTGLWLRPREEPA